MRKYGIWFWLLIKRLFKKPLFVITLILLPTLVLGMRVVMRNQSSIVKVALFAQQPASSMSLQMIKEFEDSSNNAIQFVTCNDQATMKKEIQSGKVQVGYVIPADLEKRVAHYSTAQKPVVKSIRLESELTVKIIDEFVFSRIYEYLAYDMVDQFLTKKVGTKPDASLKNNYLEYRKAQMPFEFQYENGTKNNILNETNSSYLMLPIQGMVAVLILLAAMTGGIFWYDDRRKQVFVWLSSKQREGIHFLYALVPAFLAGVFGFVSLGFTSIHQEYVHGAFVMVEFVFAVTAFLYLWQKIIPKQSWFLASIPVLTAGSLIVCPVFVDLDKWIPSIQYLRMLLPVNYYMEATYSSYETLQMAEYIVILLLLAEVINLIKRKWERK